MVGQRHVTQTLLNALRQDKVAHAYLFSGPRGTGKTTAAKILAKALNCERNPGDEPCNECSSCISIDQGTSMEVYEIDAASNRGIDEIRDLREKVKLSTAQGKYKVYIIDEVHMLTMEAFNALLKTLEEPPARVVFVLATTEAHKIPVTILSRVQRFEFHRISTEDMEARLAQVCQAIGRNVKPEALRIIAHKAEGGLRDALSILDQCLLQDGEIGPQQVYAVLGMVGEEFSSSMVDALLAADYGRAIDLLNQGVNLGRDPRQILRELLEYLRQAMLYAATGKEPLISPHLKEDLMRQSRAAGMPRLLKWISVLLEGEGELRYAVNARLAAELLLVKTIYEGENRNGASYLAPPVQPDNQNAALAGSQGAAAVQGRSAVSGTSLTATGERQDAAQTAKGQKRADPQQPAQIPSEEATPVAGVTLERLCEQWPQVLELVRKEKRSTHAFLIEANPVQVNKRQVIIAFREGFSFHRDKMRQKENKQTVERVLSAVFGVELELVSVLENEIQGAGANEKSDEEVIIRKAKEFFGPENVKVRE